MKKFILSITIILVLLLIPITAFADNQSSEFSFKIGSNTISINGKDVKLEKPYISNKVTMVPVKAIVDAFGAEMTMDPKTNTLTLKYNDIEIKLTINSKLAYVNGTKTNLTVAPVVKASTIMVPLEFICDNLGADISKDTKTSLITVTRIISGENSIKDFGLILKKTTKSKIGDSYYKWSLNHPKDLKITYRAFTGDNTKFSSVDKSYSLYLYIYKQKDETLDSVMAGELDNANNYTLISQDKQNNNGNQYIKTVFKDSEENVIVEDRAFISNGYIYYLELDVPNYADYSKNSKYKTLMDSFSTAYSKNDSIEDLSDVDQDNYRTYESKDLKWSIKVPADFVKSSDEKKSNKVTFYSNDENQDSISVEMYSIEKGMTLDNWVNHDVNEFKNNLNPKLAQVTKVEDADFNGIKSKVIYSKFTINNKDYYHFDQYMFGKDYRYDISYYISADTYNGKDKGKFDEVVKSLKFTDPNVDDVGQLTDAGMLPENTAKKTYSNSTYKWAFELPVSWTPGKSNNGQNIISYGSKNSDVILTLNAVQNKSKDDIKSYYEDSIFKPLTTSGLYQLVSSETITDKGTSIYKYNFKINSDGQQLTETIYILEKNNNAYVVSLLIQDLYDGPKNEQVMKDIWDSLKLE